MTFESLLSGVNPKNGSWKSLIYVVSMLDLDVQYKYLSNVIVLSLSDKHSASVIHC
jgi:hypothetical protein